MNQETKTILENMRRKARRETDKPVHVFPTAEKAIHTLEATEATAKLNGECSFIPPGQVCFCEPEFEDYTDRGGGLLVIHKQVVWN